MRTQLKCGRWKKLNFISLLYKLTLKDQEMLPKSMFSDSLNISMLLVNYEIWMSILGRLETRDSKYGSFVKKRQNKCDIFWDMHKY